MWLAKQYKLVPRQWMHNYTIKNNDGKTLKDLMKQYGPIPQEWQDINKMSIFDKAYSGIIPDIKEHKPEEQNEQGYTVAMNIVIYSKEIPPSEWNHDPNLQDKNGYTVAMILLLNNIKVPYVWQHKPELKTSDEKTIFDIYVQYKKCPPQWCCFEKEKRYNYLGDTQAMILAKNNISIPEYLQHDPSLKNKQGYTVALIQAKNGMIPNKEWYHDKLYRVEDNKLCTVQTYLEDQNKYFRDNYRGHWHYEHFSVHEDTKTMNTIYGKKQIPMKNGQPKKLDDYPLDYQTTEGQTLAMICARNGLIPPEQWAHDKMLKDIDQNTVAILLAYHNIIPPQRWMHDINLANKQKDTIKECLESHGIYKYNEELNKFDLNIVSDVIKAKCLKCEKEIEQEFVITSCKHKICVECFKEYAINKQYKKCPICKKENWLYYINENKCQYPLEYISHDYSSVNQSVSQMNQQKYFQQSSLIEQNQYYDQQLHQQNYDQQDEVELLQQ